MLSRRLAPRFLKSFARAASSSVPAKPRATSPAPQAPNYPSTWSTNQQPRPAAASNPRFEQTAMELQPNPLSAMELIANEPVKQVHGRKAACDGGAFTQLPTRYAIQICLMHPDLGPVGM
ncbi:hypothetical protein H0H81_005314 [Sphagnurus paluster]|uniref:Uncharacterized protein n=1 Tax=Sphagnurus paluster TaxID=117069 RepID=A0A9P7K7T5_9AGAR|nr:hypothetical protein H0H81_005314 [Sphagnurus paluster]